MDPTLLLNKDEWIKCADDIRKPPKYILVYQIYDLNNEDLTAFIELTAKRKKIPIISIGENRALKKKISVYPSPSQWVRLFLDAECVITNSFHGTLFSINYKKPFYTGLLIPIEERAANVRMRDILAYLGLSDRIIQYDDRTSWGKMDRKIAWNEVNSRIDKMKNESYQFLKSVCIEYEERSL